MELINIFTFILLIYGIFTTVIIINQIKRCNRLEEITNTVVANFEEINQALKESEEILDNPRLTEAFEHDDEVGAYFQKIKTVQQTLKNYVENGQVE